MNGTKKWQNITLRLDTSEVRGYIFKTRVKMSWPRLVIDQNFENKSVVTFPLTQIGNVSYRNITIKNPSTYNLVVQIVLDKDYPDLQLMHEGLPLNFIPLQTEEERDLNHGFFFHSNFNNLYYDLADGLNIKIHSKTLPVLLAPNQNFTFTIGFQSEDTILNSALLFIRNNLTILEVLRLKAQGAHPLFKFGNRKPGSIQPLSFELTEKHLKDCEREKPYRHLLPNLSVKRSFTARNIGDVVIYINSFFINDLPCEGYGFKILNCVPFVLHPNATKKIDIAFTPDLTLSKVTRVLILETSLSYSVNYTLHTTIPSYYLSLCSSLITRPSWESYLSYISIFFMFLLFIFIVFLAVFDAERIKRQALGTLMSSSTLSAQPVLDLRLVGQQTRAEIRSNNNSNKSEEKKLNTSDDKNDKHQGGKQETEKYTALVPVTGKSKRKIVKKCSNELRESDVDAQRRITEVQSKKKVIEDKKVKECKKTIYTNKKVTKSIIVPAYEEETSSTSTDCSSNNDDNDKEVDQRNLKSCSKKTGNNKTDSNVVHFPEEPILEVKQFTHQKAERKRSGPRQNFKNKENENKVENKNVDKKSQKTHREKKDKQHLSKKLSLDKNYKLHDKRDSPPIRISPPITSSVWGENRATFSDVVSRSDNTVNISNTRPLSQTQTSKPTMYVEPYKQTPTELGPIGSRRNDFWQDIDNLGIEEQSNSFFSNSYDLTADNNSSTFLDDFTNSNGNWAQNQSLLSLLGNTDNNLLQQDPWTPNLENFGNVTPNWDSFFGPSNENLPLQQPAVGQHPGYLWGSSSVWQPWAPDELPKTPTRTPPGFDNFAQRKNDEVK